MGGYLNPPSHPVLSDVEGRRLVIVAQGRVDDSIALWREVGADGFMFNGYRGVDQETINAVLALSNPRIIDVFYMPDIDYTAIYRSAPLIGFGVGGGTPWPDFSRLGALRSLWVDAPLGNPNDFPLSLTVLGFFGYADSNLEPIAHLKFLEYLGIASASNILSLDGIGERIVDLSVSGCPKLVDISALRGRKINRLALERCRNLKEINVIYELKYLRRLVIEKIGATVDRARVNGMHLDLSYVRK